MTTIRKIVTSKIDGDNANNNSTSEVRPFGEMAVYLDTDNNGGPDKLELLMFDGARTHLRSKVLAKGTFYGGDADSGDQGDGIENLDTIKLIPDAELHHNDGDYGNDQYIVIDPTLPNHIHVRAGGAIDSSTATLFLGGEENNVMVSDGDDQVAITTNDTHTWLFGEDGTTTLPANSSIITNETELKIATHPTTTYTFNQAYWEALNGNATRMLTPTGDAQYFSCTVTANQDGTYTVADPTGNSFAPGNWFKVPGNELGGTTPANDIQINIATVDGDGVILTTTITGTAVGKQWQFDTTGNLTLPGNLVIAGNTNLLGTNAALITPAPDLPLIALSAGANGSVSSLWIEDPFNVGTSNIAAVYANPTVGSKIVRIVVGQNGVGSGPNLWDFGTDGNLTLPIGGDIVDSTGTSVLIALTDLSVGAANSASGSGAISYANTTGVFTYTPPNLTSYISLSSLKTLVADSTDFADFKTRIAAL